MSLGLANLAASTPRSRAEELAHVLETSIRERELTTGTFFGTIDGIREETGFARATVSEAVRLLRERGLIEIRPGRGGGLFVAEATPVVRLRHTLLSVRESAASVRDAIELRDALEEFIALQAARFHEEDDMSAIMRTLGRMRRSTDDWTQFMEYNWTLHEQLSEIAPNAMARAVYQSTLGYLRHSSSSRVDQPVDRSADYRAERYRVHEDLVHAIADRDEPRVVDAVRRHNA